MSNPNGTRGYPSEAQIAMNKQSTAGIIDMELSDYSMLYTDAAQSVCVSEKYLRDMLDMATRCERDTDQFYVIVEDDMPLMLIPRYTDEGETATLGYSVTPRLNHGGSPVDELDDEETEKEDDDE